MSTAAAAAAFAFLPTTGHNDDKKEEVEVEDKRGEIFWFISPKTFLFQKN